MGGRTHYSLLPTSERKVKMKTRIIHTKIWQDAFFTELTPTQKLLFVYYISNDNIGLTGIYEITDRQVMFDTGLNREQIAEAKALFENNRKIMFKDNWVYSINSKKLNGYAGEKIDKALEKEESDIPDEIIKHFQDTLSIQYQGVSSTLDTSINHKSEIINHKSIGVVKGGLENITDEDIEKISQDYKVPREFILSKIDDIKNYCASKGKRYKDYLATLRDWVKRDAINIKKEAYGRSKIAFINPA